MRATATGIHAELPTALIDTIIELAGSSHVRSVSLPFKDLRLWTELMAIQVRRAAAAGVSPVMAMPLIASRGPVPGVHEADGKMCVGLAGYVLCISDDSIEPADLYARSNGAGVLPELAAVGENLSQAVFDPWYRQRSSYCKYFIAPYQEAPPVKGTVTRHFGEWVLYSALDPGYVEKLRSRG